MSRRRFPPALGLALPLLLTLLAAPWTAAARCIGDDGAELRAAPSPDAGAYTSSVEPRVQLQSLVQEALKRSAAVGASRLLADAARFDVEEVRAAAKPQAVLSGQVGYSAVQLEGQSGSSSGAQARAGVQIGAPLYDGGRIDRLTDWRTQLAEAARQGQIGTQEQVAVQAVSAALERSRYRVQAQVYQQYARKMSCLVEALQQIVNADKGRASELVQAQKTQAQAELQVQQSLAAMRQAELRLRRFVGDAPIPTGEGLSAVLTQTPTLDDVLAQAERSSDIVQLDAQAEAAGSYARALAAAQRPQLGWVVGGSKAVGAGSPAAMSVGINVSVPLLNPSADPALSAAQHRAEAARLQRRDALDARRSRAGDVHDQARSAFDRARRIVEVLRDSERVRNFTLQQWQQLGKRSLFDVMSAEGDHYNLRASYINALYDAQQANALLWSLGSGLAAWLQ